MNYLTDSSTQQYLEVDFGWDNNDRLRFTYIDRNRSVRISKVVQGGHPYPGPEPEITKIPLIIEALAKIFNDFGR